MFRLRSRCFGRLSFLLLCLGPTHPAHGRNHETAPLTIEEQMRAHHVGDTVAISELSGARLRAKIVSVGEASMVVKNAKGANVDIAYSDVASVRKGGLSRKAKVWIVIGVIWVALSIVGTQV